MGKLYIYLFISLVLISGYSIADDIKNNSSSTDGKFLAVPHSTNPPPPPLPPDNTTNSTNHNNTSNEGNVPKNKGKSILLKEPTYVSSNETIQSLLKRQEEEEERKTNEKHSQTDRKIFSKNLNVTIEIADKNDATASFSPTPEMETTTILAPTIIQASTRTSGKQSLEGSNETTTDLPHTDQFTRGSTKTIRSQRGPIYQHSDGTTSSSGGIDSETTESITQSSTLSNSDKIVTEPIIRESRSKKSRIVLTVSTTSISTSSESDVPTISPTSSSSSPMITKTSVTSSVSSNIRALNRQRNLAKQREEKKAQTSSLFSFNSSRRAKKTSTTQPPVSASRNGLNTPRRGQGVCATPYGKMTVGQAIHWIGCRRITCRSQRGFPYLLEQTCPPLPTNLPPGCNILQPSRNLPYPSCCPMPSCPPLTSKQPRRFSPVLPPSPARYFHRTHKAVLAKKIATPVSEKEVKIDESKSKIGISISKNETNQEIETPINSYLNISNAEILLNTELFNDRNDSVSNQMKENINNNIKNQSNFEETTKKGVISNNNILSNDSEFVESDLSTKHAKKIIDMLVGKNSVSSKKYIADPAYSIEKEVSQTETEIKAANDSTEKHTINKLYNETSETQINKSNTSKVDNMNGSTEGNQALHEDEDTTSAEFEGKVEDPFMTHFNDRSYKSNFKKFEFPSFQEDLVYNDTKISLIKASFKTNDPRLKETTKQTDEEIKVPLDQITSEIHLTKITLVDGYSNVEQAEVYNFSNNSSLTNNQYQPKNSSIVVTNDNIAEEQATDESIINLVKKKDGIINFVNISKNNEKSETIQSHQSKPDINIVETRPNYIKLFSMIKNATGNDSIPTNPYKLLSKAIIPNNLNRNEALTLAIVSEAIERGLNDLLAEKLNNTIKHFHPKKTNYNGSVDFIYIGINPTNQSGNNTKTISKKQSLKDTKQVERTRRNTANQKLSTNELLKHETERKKPVFFIPWRKSETGRSSIAAESSKISEVTTKATQTPLIVTPISQRSTTITPTTNSLPSTSSVTSKLATKKISVLTKDKQTNFPSVLTTRRSRSRMTIPRIPFTRSRGSNSTNLNTKLSDFTRNAYAKYLKRQLKGNKAATTEIKSTAASEIDSTSSASERRRSRGRRRQVTASTTIAAPTENSKVKEKNLEDEQKSASVNQVNRKQLTREERLKNLRERLVNRRRSPIVKADIKKKHEVTELRSPEERPTTPPELLKKIAIVTESTLATDKLNEEMGTTLPVLTLSSDTKAQAKINDQINRRRNQSLSSRLRFQNMINPRKRARASVKKSVKSLNPAKLPLLVSERQEIVKKDESDISLNTIEDVSKVHVSTETSVGAVNKRKRPSVEQRALLLKLIRERSKARYTARRVDNLEPDKHQNKVVEEKKLDSAAPKQIVELKRIPLKNISSKLSEDTTQPQSISQRLNPRPVAGVVASIQRLTTIRPLAPIRVINSPNMFNKIVHPQITLPNRSVKSSAENQQLVKPVRRQKIITVQQPHTTKAPIIYVAPQINQIVRHPHQEQNLQLFTHSAQPQQGHQNINQIRTQPPKIYHPINQLVHTPVNNLQHEPQRIQPQPQQNLVTLRDQKEQHHQQNSYHQQHQNHQKQRHPQRQHVITPNHQPHQQQRKQNPKTNHNHQSYDRKTQRVHPARPKTEKPAKKENAYHYLPTVDDFPEMEDDYESSKFDFGPDEDFEYKEPQFVIDYRKKKKEDAYKVPKESKHQEQKIPKGAKVTENEYFVDGPSGVPIKVTTVTFHTSKSTVRNENVKNRSSHFKTNPFGDN